MNVGIDIGGTKMIAAIWNPDGSLRQTAKAATPPKAEDSIALIARLVAELGRPESLAHLTIAAPGLIDYERGILVGIPNLPWHHFPIRERVEAALGIIPLVEHDAAAGGYSEAIGGAGLGYQRVLYLTISTGIGTGLIDGGHIIHGAHGIEGGHITILEDGPLCSCGGHGHLEALVSGRAIKKRFGRLASEIHDEATWNIIAHELAIGIASLSVALSPDVVVLGGGVSTHYARFGDLLQRHLHSEEHIFPLPPVVPARYIETAVVRGALMLADAQD